MCTTTIREHPHSARSLAPLVPTPLPFRTLAFLALQGLSTALADSKLAPLARGISTRTPRARLPVYLAQRTARCRSLRWQIPSNRACAFQTFTTRSSSRAVPASLAPSVEFAPGAPCLPLLSEASGALQRTPTFSWTARRTGATKPTRRGPRNVSLPTRSVSAGLAFAARTPAPGSAAPVPPGQ